MSQSKLFNRDFSLVVLGQIISLFGNAILRFALPLHLLNQTQDPALFGIVTACSFIPMILLSPVGGMIADRVNKRNIMVILDFATAALILIFSCLYGKVDLVLIFLVTLMLLYGIQGAYQPAVQASIPALVQTEQIVSANAVINQVSSLAGLIGPVAGGALYGFFGLRPILFVSIGCFLFSAIMEIFIHIPFNRTKSDSSIWNLAYHDLRESFSFIRHEQPAIGNVMWIISGFNLFLSALLIIGVPVLITQTLSLPADTANRLYGYTQGAMAAGGLAGGLLTGILAKHFNMRNVHLFLVFTSVLLLPIGIVLLFDIPVMITYLTITLCCFLIMASASAFTIQMLSFVQTATPSHMVGKVISCAIALSMCAQPIGQAMYGKLFAILANIPYTIIFGAAVVSFFISAFSKTAFGKLKYTQS